MMRRPAVFILVLLAAGCSTSSTRGDTPPATPEQTAKAEELTRDLDAELEQISKAPPADRSERENAFAQHVEQALGTTTGTRFENKTLYWLAFWRFSHHDDRAADLLLDRLAKLASPALKNFGTALRVRVRLHQGRTAEARAIAEPLAAQVAEFSALLPLIAFHERVGQPAPHVASRNLTGGPEDPLAERKEPWLVYVFLERCADNSLLLVKRYHDAIAGQPPGQEARVVCITFQSDLLDAPARLRETIAGDQLDLLWANPGEGGSATRWIEAWKLPQPLPHSAVLGPDRSIMAVEVEPESLGKLLRR